MPFTMDSKLGDLLKSEKAREVMEKYVPGSTSHPQIALGKGLPLKLIVGMPQAKQAGFTKEKVQAVLEEVNRAEQSGAA